MHKKTLIGFCGTVLTLGVIAACSNSGSGTNPGGTGGAAGSGGVAGTGAAAGTGGNGITGCDLSKCQQGLQTTLAVLGSGVTTCCVDTSECGLDYSGVPSSNPLYAILPKTCSLPLTDAGLMLPPPPKVRDGGIIDVPDGGKPILLDTSCTGASVPPLAPLPGCCQPTGLCGSSTSPLVAFRLPLECADNGSIKSQLGALVSIPPPKVCTYDVPGEPVVTGHLPDGGGAGGDAGGHQKDAGTRDKDAGKKR